MHHVHHEQYDFLGGNGAEEATERRRLCSAQQEKETEEEEEEEKAEEAEEEGAEETKKEKRGAGMEGRGARERRFKGKKKEVAFKKKNEGTHKLWY